MTAHFGATGAEKNNMLLDFDAMKREFQNYEQWHPKSRALSAYQRGFEEQNV